MNRFAIPIFALATALASSAPAYAHISLQVPTGAAGASYKAILQVPHGCAGPTAEPVRTHLHASGIMGTFEILGKGDARKATVALDVEDAGADIRSVRMLLTTPVDGAVPLTLIALRTGRDIWSADAQMLSSGRWTVVVEVRIGDFDLVKLKGAVRVR